MYVLFFALWKIGLWFGSPVRFVSDTVFSHKYHKENTSSEPALFSLARKQGSSPFRALRQRINNVMEGKQQRLKIDVSASNISCLLTPGANFFPSLNQREIYSTARSHLLTFTISQIWEVILGGSLLRVQTKNCTILVTHLKREYQSFRNTPVNVDFFAIFERANVMFSTLAGWDNVCKAICFWGEHFLAEISISSCGCDVIDSERSAVVLHALMWK